MALLSKLSDLYAPRRRYILTVAILVLVLYAVLPQLGIFRSSWHLLKRPDLSWVALAICLTAMTYIAGALTYCLLALKPLRYSIMLVVQLAAMFVNRLLPGGVGALGVNFAYLRRARFSTAEATSLVAINNLLGVIGHSLLIGGALLLTADQADRITPSFGNLGLAFKILIGVTLAVLAVLLFVGRHRVRGFLHNVGLQLASYKQRPWRLGGALLSSMLLTTANVLCLACSALALGVHLPFVAILLIFSFGVSAGAATPTPGGLGGFEAGLVGGLATYNVSSAEALAVALLYRLISYWLPLIVGAIAFAGVQRRLLPD